MGFSDLKLVYVVSCVVLGLIIVTPTLAAVVSFPGGERFSELWLLGQGHMAEDYPFSVRAGESYGFYLGLGNHMGSLEDYLVFVKFRNQSESLPDSVNGTASGLEPVFEYRAFVGDGDVWEKELSLSVDGVVFDGNACRISRLVLDGEILSVDKVAEWDSVNRGFYCQLFFELWFYNSAVSGFQYHNRFVGLWLNMTI